MKNKDKNYEFAIKSFFGRKKKWKNIPLITRIVNKTHGLKTIESCLLCGQVKKFTEAVTYFIRSKLRLNVHPKHQIVKPNHCPCIREENDIQKSVNFLFPWWRNWAYSSGPCSVLYNCSTKGLLVTMPAIVATLWGSQRL